MSISIRTTADEYGLPIVSFSTDDALAPSESAAVSQAVVTSVMLAVLMASWLVLPDAGDLHLPDIVLILFVLMFLVAYIGYMIGAPDAYVRNPKLRPVGNIVQIKIEAWGACLAHAWVAPGQATGEAPSSVAPYDENLSFTVDSSAQWFGKPGDEATPGHPMVLTRGFNGEVVPLVGHWGPAAELSRVHAVLTQAFVVNYARNRQVADRVQAEKLSVVEKRIQGRLTAEYGLVRAIGTVATRRVDADKPATL